MPRDGVRAGVGQHGRRRIERARDLDHAGDARLAEPGHVHEGPLAVDQREVRSGQSASAPRAATSRPSCGRPVALAAELGAPRPEPARDEVQRVLVREADGAVGLVRDAGAEAGRLARAHLGAPRSRRPASPRSAARNALLGGDAGRGHVTGEERQVVLDGLEAADGPAELLALAHVAHRLREQVLERRPPSGPSGPGRRTADSASAPDLRPAGAARDDRRVRPRSACRAARARGCVSGSTLAALAGDERDHRAALASATTTTWPAARAPRHARGRAAELPARAVAARASAARPRAPAPP